MLVLKYIKDGAAVYVPHLDTLRVIIRSIRRADIKAGYSAGYNPHMLLFMSPPLAVGVKSRAEYVFVETSEAIDGIKRRFNKFCPEGFNATRVFECAKNPNISGIAAAAEYEIKIDGAEKRADEIKGLTDGKNLVIDVEARGKTEAKNVSDKIFGFKTIDGGFKVVLACGNNNLRPDKFADGICKKFGLNEAADITKTKLFTAANGKLIDMDRFLRPWGAKTAHGVMTAVCDRNDN
jgi:radical SAM-linked protein